MLGFGAMIPCPFFPERIDSKDKPGIVSILSWFGITFPWLRSEDIDVKGNAVGSDVL